MGKTIEIIRKNTFCSNYRSKPQRKVELALGLFDVPNKSIRIQFITVEKSPLFFSSLTFS